MIFGLLVLLAGPVTPPGLVVFGVALGVGNGVMTIVRGTAVAELYGRERYAELNGALAAPGVIAKAAAPLVLASIWAHTGTPRAVPLATAGLVLVGVAALGMLRFRESRNGSRPA
jgi:MFS family permease